MADAREIAVADEARFQLAGIPSDRDCADARRMLGVLGIVCSAGSVYDPAYEAAEPPVERRVVHAGRYGVCYPIGQDPASPLSSPRSETRGATYWPDSGSTDPHRVLPSRSISLYRDHAAGGRLLPPVLRLREKESRVPPVPSGNRHLHGLCKTGSKSFLPAEFN